MASISFFKAKSTQWSKLIFAEATDGHESEALVALMT